MEPHPSHRWIQPASLQTAYERHGMLLPKRVVSEFCESNLVVLAHSFLHHLADTPPFEEQASILTQPLVYKDHRSIRWVAANQEGLYRLYPDEWILVDNESVIAHSTDPLEIQEAADKHGATTAFMARVAPPSKLGRLIYGR